MHIWNQLLVDHFFNSGRAGKRVRLNVTADLLAELGSSRGWNHEDFLTAAARGSAVLPKRTRNVCEYAYDLYRCWRDPLRLPAQFVNVPPFVAYLGLWVYLATLEDDDHRSFHRRLWQYFPVDERDTPPPMYPDFGLMQELWIELERWSGRRRGCGSFRMLRLGQQAHLSIPKAQAILTEGERQRLPSLFDAAELSPESPLQAERLRQVLNEFGSTYLSARTMHAFHAGEDMAAYLFDDLRYELRRWDGTAPDDRSRNGVNAETTRRTAELVLFLEPRSGRLTPRMRFETTLEEALEPAAYHGGFSVPDLLGSPAPGWSSPVSDRAGAPFDASRIAWEDDHTWESVAGSSPKRLKFPGRALRVFVPATRFRMGGLVEGDELPASGWCCVAAANSKLEQLTQWLARLPRNSYAEESVALPAGWTLYRLKPVPSEASVRAEFPGGAEAYVSILRLRGGLRLRRGQSSEYHTFSPPRVEVGGERDGVEVRANDALLTEVNNGVFELPRDALAGEYRIEAFRGTEIIDETTVRLVDVAHAGSPTAVRGWMDSFGQFHEGASGGWAGGWIEADGLASFDPRLYVAASPQANISGQLEERNVSDVISLNELFWGVHPGSLSTADEPLPEAEVWNYPVQYFRDLWLLNTDRPPEHRQRAAQRVWEFHAAHELFYPTAGLPLPRLKRLPRRIQVLRFAEQTSKHHAHEFQCSEPIREDLAGFLRQVGAEEYYLKIRAADKDPYRQSSGPPFHAPCTGNLPAQGRQAGRRTQLLTRRGTHYHQTVYELGRLSDESGWDVGRSEWDNKHSRWEFPWCCESRGPLLVKAWTGAELMEQLRLSDWLRTPGATGAVPEGLSWPHVLDSYLFEQPDMGAVHRRVLEMPPMRQTTLHIKGMAPAELGMIPDYADISASVKLAWRLAWIDRLAAWEGKNAIFSSLEHAGSLLPFLKAIRVAQLATTEWAGLFTRCLAIAEYMLTILRGRGLGPAFGFLPPE